MISFAKQSQSRVKVFFAGLALVGLPLLTVFSHQAYAATAYNATSVIGQLNFTSVTANQGGGTTASAATISGAKAVALDSLHHRLFVADASNARVLVYNLDSSNNLTSSSATLVLGQANMTASTAVGFSNGFTNPFALAYDADDNLLFVVDADAHRVVVFNTATITNGMNATYVLGQPNLSTSSSALTQAGLNSPEGVAYDSTDHLVFVADTLNNRVLAYSTTSLANGMNASYVLGQANYTTGTLGTTQAGLYNPIGLAYDASDRLLFVADNQNRRVVAFSTASLANGMNASYVLGQANYTSRTILTTQNGMTTPNGLAYDSVNKLLYVSDDVLNQRILAFSVTGLSNYENAVSVIGQTDFVSSSTGSTQSTLNRPFGLAFDATNNRLYAADWLNNRVMAYNFVKLTTASLVNGVVGSGYSQTFAVQNSQGTVSYSVTSGALPTGLTLNAATGVISGKPTVAGTFNFEITVTDNNGTIGSFFQDPAYTIVVGAATSTTSGSSAVSAPNTGFGVNLTHPERTIAAYGLVAVVLSALAYTSRRLAKRQ